MNLNNKQKNYLRKLGHSLKPVFHIGKQGFTETSKTELEQALLAHELIKVKVLPNAPKDAKEIAQELPSLLACHVVQQVGHMLLIYKTNEKKPKIFFPE